MKSLRRGSMTPVLVICALLACGQTACYNKYFISKPQLEKLESRVDQQANVAVIIDGCDVAANPAEGGLAGPRIAEAAAEGASDGGEAKVESQAAENIDPATGCPTVKVNTSSPLKVVTTTGSAYRVTPFNFSMTDTQLVSPDYDLLLAITDVEGAEVQTFSGWKTGLTIGGGVVAAVATFAIISLTADADRGFGQQ